MENGETAAAAGELSLEEGADGSGVRRRIVGEAERTSRRAKSVDRSVKEELGG